VLTVGGLSALVGTASQGALCDVLWSDPIGPNTEDDGWDPDKRDQVTYVANWDRGAGQFYGLAAVREFITHNKLDGIIRAHEVREPVRARRVSMPPLLTACCVLFLCHVQMEEGVRYHYRDASSKYPLVRCQRLRMHRSPLGALANEHARTCPLHGVF